MKKIKILLTVLVTLCVLNLQGVEESAGSGWSEKGDLWREFSATNWFFKIQNKIRENAVLTLQIIQDNDVNSKKTPIFKLEAAAGKTESVPKKINLPAIYRIEVKREKGKCKWNFSSGSLLRTWTDFIFLSEEDSTCGQAQGIMTLKFNKDTKSGELIFTLTDVEEIQNIKELN